MTRILAHALVLAIVAGAGPRAAHALEAADLPNAIENAKTAADHEAIASYFEEEAKAARATAAEHKRMGAFYKAHPSPAGAKGVRHSLHATMPEHCERVAKSYEAAAQEFEEMAAAHREAASAIK